MIEKQKKRTGASNSINQSVDQETNQLINQSNYGKVHGT